MTYESLQKQNCFVGQFSDGTEGGGCSGSRAAHRGDKPGPGPSATVSRPPPRGYAYTSSGSRSWLLRHLQRDASILLPPFLRGVVCHWVLLAIALRAHA